MNKKHASQRLFSLLSIALLLALSLWMSFGSHAEDEPLASEGDYLCGEQLALEADALILDYQAFLEAQTLDARDNSSRLDELMHYYRYVSYQIEDRFQELSLEDTAGESFSSSADEYAFCASVRDQYLLLAENMLRNTNVSSTGSKTSFRVIDGMKAINENVQGLSDSFHKSFPSFFNKFNSALPCYVNSCVSR